VKNCRNLKYKWNHYMHDRTCIPFNMTFESLKNPTVQFIWKYMNTDF